MVPDLGVAGTHNKGSSGNDLLCDSPFFKGYCVKEGISLSGFHRSVPETTRVMRDFFKYMHAGAEPNLVSHVDLAFDVLGLVYESCKNRCETVKEPEIVFSQLRLQSSSSLDGRRAGPTKAHLLHQWVNDKDGSVLNDAWDWYSRRLCRDRRNHSVSAKCEVRPDSKLGKTRAFINMSVYSYVGCFALFHHTNIALTEYAHWRSIYPEHFPGAHCVGIPAQHKGFDRVLRRIHSRKHIMSLDASHWDGSMLAYYMAKCALFRWNLLAVRERTMQNWLRLCNIMRDAIFSRLHCPDGTIRYKCGGMPSGLFTTLSDNSLINEALTIAAWLVLTYGEDAELPTPEEALSGWVATTDAACMGDDDLIGSDDDFSVEQWIEAFSLFNLEVTEGGSEFLSHDISEKNGIMYLKARGEKMFAKLAFGKHKEIPVEFDDLQYEYVRACGVRTELYPDTNAFEVIDKYVDYLEDYIYYGTPFRETPAFAAISSVRVPKEELESLWF